MLKLSKPVLYAAVLGGLAIMWTVMNPPDSPSTKRVKPAAPKTSVSSRGVIYTQEDYKAKFTPVNLTAKNAFKPLVVRTNRSLEAPEGPSGIPPALALGEAGWTYTGTVEVDGVLQALLENPTTGGGDFVKVGDTWKSARVMEIASDKVVLTGAAGTATTVRLHGTEELATAGSLPPAKVSGPLRGPIGPLSVRPDRTNRQTPTTAAEGTSDGN